MFYHSGAGGGIRTPKALEMSPAKPPFLRIFGRSRIKLEHKIINCPYCGKIISKDILNGNYVRPEVACPECGSQRRNAQRKESALPLW